MNSMDRFNYLLARIKNVSHCTFASIATTAAYQAGISIMSLNIRTHKHLDTLFLEFADFVYYMLQIEA